MKISQNSPTAKECKKFLWLSPHCRQNEYKKIWKNSLWWFALNFGFQSSK